MNLESKHDMFARKFGVCDFNISLSDAEEKKTSGRYPWGESSELSKLMNGLREIESDNVKRGKVKA